MRRALTVVALLVAASTSAAQAPAVWPDSQWQRATPAEMGMDSVSLARARDLALQAGGSGFVVRGGKLVMSWGDPKARYDLKSSTKSIGLTALGLARKDGKIELHDLVARFHLNLDTGKVTPEGGLAENHAKAMGKSAFLLPETSLTETATRVETSANTGADSDTTANVRNWMESVRSRSKPNADIEAGYNHSLALVMTIAAIQTGRKVTFDDSRQQIASA